MFCDYEKFIGSCLILNREIETSTRALASLCSIFEQAKRIRVKCGTSSLFPPGKHEAIELFNIASSIDQHPFYGRCIGLHVMLWNFSVF